MSRYTKDNGFGYEVDLYDMSNAVNKLGKTEDLLEKYGIPDLEYLEKCIQDHDKYGELGEQIGCPLEIVLKLLNQNKLYYQFYDELQEWTSIKVDLRKKVVWYCKQVGGHYALSQPLCNYGKTFWLRKDKSE